MTKSRKKNNRPAILKKPFKDPYAALARSNVGSFLDAYSQKHKAYGTPRKMLPDFVKFLSKKNPELAGFKESVFNTEDATTKGFYDCLRHQVDNRKKKPPPSPKQPREEESVAEAHMMDHNDSF